MTKRNTRFQPGVSGNESGKWKPGQSGNPAGKSKRRTQFEELFNEALITEGSPEEAAKLLWESARGKEPWAIQELCRRFAPQTESLRMVHEVEDDRLDCSKLTDKQIKLLEEVFEEADGQSAPVENRESASPTA